ncbi:MAG: hypothetical protein ACE5KW_02215, partial [Dehalococcoidia bacterium]
YPLLVTSGQQTIEEEELEVCLSLDPQTDTNTMGDEHTVTATITFTLSGEPVEGDLSGLPVLIFVFDGPNAGESISGDTDPAGQLALTYTGDGGPGTDTIGAVACIEVELQIAEDLITSEEVRAQNGVDCALDAGGIEECIADPESCLAFLTDPDVEDDCTEREQFICDVATKEWVEPEPAPAPVALAAVQAPTPTPTPKPVALGTAQAPAALPASGSGDPLESAGSGGLPWAAAIAAAIGFPALMGAGAVARRRALPRR